MSAAAFTDTVNGREKTTDGLWTHRGSLMIKDSSGPSLHVAEGQITTRRQIVSVMDVPPLSPNAFVDGQLQLQTGLGDAPRIGFHEVGSTGLSLYKKPGVRELWVMDNIGGNYPLVGAPASVNALLFEAVYVGNGMNQAATGAWQVVAQSRTPGVSCRGDTSIVVDYSLTIISDYTGASHYIGVGMDDMVHTHFFNATSTAGACMNHAASHRFAPVAGMHSFCLFVNANGAGNWNVWTGGYNYIRVWELRA